MSKGFGIAALVLAVLAIFVPVAGVFLSAIACAFATIAGVCGDRGLAIATALLAGVNTFFLSPSLWMVQEGGPNQGRSPLVATITVALMVVPIVGVSIGARRGAPIDR
jgi:hypothetical protein